jgi:hypothetical protein
MLLRRLNHRSRRPLKGGQVGLGVGAASGRGWHEIGEPLHERGFRLAIATAETIDIQAHSLACLDDALRRCDPAAAWNARP